MTKTKKIELRYGDVLKFETPFRFGGQSHFLHGELSGFQEDTFLVDILPPARGKKLSTIELRSAADPQRVCAVKGWKSMKYEVISRLPDDCVVFKSKFKQYNNMIQFKQLIIGYDGTTWDHAAQNAYAALDAAREMGCALVVFRSMGYIEVYPFPEGVPSLETLQEAVDDPYGTIAPVDASALGGTFYGPYIAYAGDNALMADQPILNKAAQFALTGDPTIRELREQPYGADPHPHLYAGSVALLVGFSICAETGDTIRTPIAAPAAVGAA